ncbi:MAG: hypothetical protein H6739_22215 [Alphaproteobacteria bacterium]|nr:hypothetical protein [Alphaproteobacteria bacterium]
MTSELTPRQTAEVVRQIAHSLDKSPAFRGLSPAERREIRQNTDTIVRVLERAPDTRPSDPYAIPLETTGTTVNLPTPGAPSRRQGRATAPYRYPGSSGAPDAHRENQMNFDAASTMAGARATGAFLREVDFPAFVAQLVTGTFDAIVQASIEQMKAYGELVQSVVMSANEFRDQNVSEAQAKDHLVSRYPNVFQLNLGDSGPQVSPRGGGFFDEMPDFASELGLSEPVSELDEETINEKILPAVRDNLARDRQRMLATMVLMGINRIIVTDGRINAKVKFSFTASDRSTRQAMAIDYAHMGTTVVEHEGESYEEPAYNADAEGSSGDSTARRIVTGAYNYVEKPEIKIASLSKSESQGGLDAAGSIFGEVAINFRSETFPLEQLVNTDQMLRLNAVQSGAHGAPATAPAAAPAPGTTPAPAPAPTTPQPQPQG